MHSTTILRGRAVLLKPRTRDTDREANVHLLQSHIDEAIVWLERARSAMPGVPIFRSRLAAAYALNGKTEQASAELAEARKIQLLDRVSEDDS
jgi:predicted Zn-dependent protease